MEISPFRLEKLEKFASEYSLNFSNYENLNRAFVHPSYLNKFPDVKSYETLEFLGDAVLKLIVSDYFYLKFREANEGELTEKRNKVVSDVSFSQFAKKLNYWDLILFSDELKSSQVNKNTVLACVFEALLGAIYLDLGIEYAKKFFFDNFEEMILELAKTAHETNYRALLQDYTQKKDGSKPEFTLISETGKQHCKTFVYEVSWKGEILGKGEAKTKKQAMSESAKHAVKFLKQRGEL